MAKEIVVQVLSNLEFSVRIIKRSDMFFVQYYTGKRWQVISRDTARYSKGFHSVAFARSFASTVLATAVVTKTQA